MPQHIRSSKISMPPGETHLTITLELNINITAEGAQATVGTVQAAKVKDDSTSKDDDVVFMVPDFSATPLIEFGEKVEDDATS